jgi:DNA helicase-2/ATP-dependent DNA helicase PcrA
MILDGWKNRGLTPEQVPAGEAASFANGKGKKLYIAYQERLKTLNAADFGDLLLECTRLFREHPDVLRQYQTRFSNPGGRVSGYERGAVFWLRLLGRARPPFATAHRREAPLAGEGRAPPHVRPTAPPAQEHLLRRRRRPVDLRLARAEVDNILRFEHDFPGATIIRLERNYRSTARTSSPPPRT